MGSCSTCSKNRVDFKCALCDQEICKSCTEFLAEDAFHYSDEKPFDMQKNHFCINCHIQKVLPELDAYEDLLNKAKNIRVFDKSQSKETRLIRRVEKPIVVKDGADQQDVTLKMAFIAVKKDFNAIIDVDIKSEKVRLGSYQTSLWKGTCVPANVSDSKLIKDRSFRDNPS